HSSGRTFHVTRLAAGLFGLPEPSRAAQTSRSRGCRFCPTGTVTGTGGATVSTTGGVTTNGGVTGSLDASHVGSARSPPHVVSTFFTTSLAVDFASFRAAEFAALIAFFDSANRLAWSRWSSLRLRWNDSSASLWYRRKRCPFFGSSGSTDIWLRHAFSCMA